MPDKYKLAVISDSPLLHTGFGTVIAELNKGFCEIIEVHHLGLHHHDFDKDSELPYYYYPVPHMDDLAHQNYGKWLRSINPDLIFILSDPGNVLIYADGIVNQEQYSVKVNNEFVPPPIVAYTPIEGSPSPASHGDGLQLVEYSCGKVVVYCDSAKKILDKQFPWLNPEVVNHGLDHFPAEWYSDEDRKILRKLVGLEDKFVVASGGVNKRTKGMDTLIYTAKIMKQMGVDKDVMFYLHTNPYDDTMWGYKLAELCDYYGVQDMVMFKPEANISKENYWLGIERYTDTLGQIKSMDEAKTPATSKERGYLFATYDFVSRLNCADLYVDASQVEGWALFPGEFMACGVPVISVKDDHVREEIYGMGAYMIDALPHRVWTTWHSGMRLVAIDPLSIAVSIAKMRQNDKLREHYAQKGYNLSKIYKWDNAREKMNEIVMSVAENFYNGKK